MERAAVSAATGALEPVLEKLTGFLGDERTLPEGSKTDIMSIRSELERMHSLLRRIWGREDLDVPCKDWMMEVRELSYDMEDAIDDFIDQRTSEIPLEELKIRVKDVSDRSCACEMWKMPNSSKPVVDPRSRFVHRDASELVGMEELKDELIELVVKGVDKREDSSRRRIGTPLHATRNMKGKIVIMLGASCEKHPSKAMAVAASQKGVESVGYGRWNGTLTVVGYGVDPIKLIAALRKNLGYAHLLQVGDLARQVQEQVSERGKPPAAYACQRSDEIKTVCILGFAGGGKTALAELAYQAAGEQFDCRAFVSVSPSPNITGILRAILTEVTNDPHAGTEAAGEQYLIHEISKFLAGKRYLVIIDDIWHWEEWEIIRMSLPKNNLGSSIIITTRIDAIAEKCRTENNDAFVYETGVLDSEVAWRLLNTTVMKSVEHNRPGITRDFPCYDITEMCYGMPLAIICMSSALAEQTQGLDGALQSLRALRRVEDGILNIPSLKPLAESLCLGYSDLRLLHLRTFLLYCSVYSWHAKFEKGRLLRRWIAERFVCEEEAAEGFFDELVDREWIKQVEGGKYEIHPMMLAFLRCKSQEDNFVTCLGFCSDIPSPCTRRIRRLSLQHRHSVDFSRLDSSHTRSLVIFGSASAVPFKQFERLRVLELEDVEDIENAHLVDICGLLWLRYLGLKEAPITELPPEIGRLLHLETLDVRGTRVTELPWEAGKLPKSVRVLAGDNDSCQGIELPEGVCQALENGILESSKCREVLSILVYDRFGLGTVPPEVGVFKVPGRRMHIPRLIKGHFKGLSSLDIRLCKLGEDDLKFLQEMPNLKALVVRFEVVPEKPVTIGAAGFAILESFCVDSRVPRVTFEPGAMLKLKRLAFKVYAGPASEDPVGITHLRSLEVVVFRCSPWYRRDSPGIRATVSVVRREAGEHPNRITLWINDKEEIFPEKQGAQVCHGDAGSSGTSGIEAEEADILCAQRNNLEGNDATASCSRPSEIEEVCPIVDFD